MQTWLPYPDYTASAKVLDNKRLGKQRVETLQIFQALSCRRLQATTTVTGPRGGTKRFDLPESDWVIQNTSVGWVNHPATKMWAGAFVALLDYQTAMCNEWTERGHEDTCLRKTEFLFTDIVDWTSTDGTPKWRGNEEFHAAHRSNLLRKDPAWYGKWGWEEPDNLEYVWP